MKKSDKIIISMAGALIIGVFSVTMGGFSKQCAAVRSSTLRLHIIANSDSNEDQTLKLYVRDADLEQYGEIMAGCSSRESAEKTIEILKEDIKKTSIKTLKSNNCNDDVTVSLQNMYFDNRKYDDGIIMPAGKYDALRIVIGEGKGRNWWCVMYPPLCIPVACEEEGQEVSKKIMLLSEAPNYEVKFAVVEIVEKIKEKLRD